MEVFSTTQKICYDTKMTELPSMLQVSYTMVIIIVIHGWLLWYCSYYKLWFGYQDNCEWQLSFICHKLVYGFNAQQPETGFDLSPLFATLSLLHSFSPHQCLEYNFSAEGWKEVRKRTFSQLYEDVAMYAAAMKKMGVQKGDRVVGEF